jgi:hypothetical protein
VSFTVTVNVHIAVLPDVSVAVLVTVVTPFGNAEPDAGELTTVTPGQLSVAVTVNVVTAEHRFGSVDLVMFDGHVICGAWVSFTVTVNVHVDVLGGVAASLTEHVTVVTPLGNVEPDGGLHAGVPTPGQLSVAVGSVKVATAEHWPASFDFVMLVGQFMSVGACVSFTVTVKLQDAGFPAASLVEQVTVVTPSANAVPDAGVHVTAGLVGGQLSVAVGAV